MQTEEKIRLEDRLTTNQRQLMDAESQLREVQAQCDWAASMSSLEIPIFPSILTSFAIIKVKDGFPPISPTSSRILTSHLATNP